MEIIEVNISEIKLYEKNTKIHSKEQIKNVSESIEQFGWQQPIVIDKNKIIIIGHCRYLAAKRLKLKTVPCAIAENLTDEQVKKLRLIDNKTNESEWDLDLLGEELSSIQINDFDFDWGVNLEDAFAYTEIVEDDFDIDSAIPEKPKSKLGDIYQLGNHRLMCGDSTNYDDVNKLVGLNEIDLLLTDPPYNVDYEDSEGNKLKNDNLENSTYFEFLKSSFTNAYEKMKEGASFYVWHASKQIVNVYNSITESNLNIKQYLIWNKNSLVIGRQDYQWKHEPCFYGWKEGAKHNWFNDRKQTTVLDFDRPIKSDLHPTMKPLKLFDYLIKNSSKKEDNVLDLFGGSGTTLICCEQNNRNCFMMEYDPKYVDVIIKRWETLTGKKAIKI